MELSDVSLMTMFCSVWENSLYSYSYIDSILVQYGSEFSVPTVRTFFDIK